MEYSKINNSRSNRLSRSEMHQNSNNRLFERDMGDINVINKKINPIRRIDIERDEFMKSSLNQDEDDNYIQKSNNFESFDNNNGGGNYSNFNSNSDNYDKNFDKRMPMRPSYNINTPIYEFEKRAQSSNISSFDQSQNNNNNKFNNQAYSFADIDADTKLTTNLQPNTTCINGINNYGLFFFDNMIQIMNSAFVFSPYLIYSIFASLYLSSEGNTEIELKNYFNFPRTDLLFDGLKQVQFKLNMGNCIIFSDDISYNQQYCNDINMFTKIRKVNRNNADREALEINAIISKMTGNTKKSISSDNIRQSNVILLNYACIKPTWICNFSQITQENGVEFMHAYNQTVGYYDQPNLQVLELASVDNLCFGIVYGDIDLNDKTLKLITSSLKPVTLSEIRIPKMKLQTKLRYINILKETDLKTVFLDLKAPQLFNDQCEISDCLQNIEFEVTNNCATNIKAHGGVKSPKKFIVQQSFRFYLRSAANNCIILLGSY